MGEERRQLNSACVWVNTAIVNQGMQICGSLGSLGSMEEPLMSRKASASTGGLQGCVSCVFDGMGGRRWGCNVIFAGDLPSRPLIVQHSPCCTPCCCCIPSTDPPPRLYYKTVPSCMAPAQLHSPCMAPAVII